MADQDLFDENEPDYNEEDDLYASYDAFKALLNAGLSRREALERTGLDEETLQALEQEDDVIDFKSDAKEVWEDEENIGFDDDYMDKLGDDGEEGDDWKEEDGQDDYSDDYGSSKGGGWDDFE